MKMTEKAYAKINLILNVLNKRSDGYHNIDFLMANVDIYDLVSVETVAETSYDSIEVIGNEFLSNEKNIAFIALKKFKAKYNIIDNFKITIDKKIPISAGLAGGSSDAAAVLRILNRLTHKNLSYDELKEIGLLVGSDVPFCIHSQFSRVGGTGEKILLLENEIPESCVLVINPGVELSTKKVYENHISLNQKKSYIEDIILQKNYFNFYSRLSNDLEKTAEKLEPKIKEIKKEIEKTGNYTKIMLSGSGPTVLVFDKNKKNLEVLKEHLKKKYSFVELCQTIFTTQQDYNQNHPKDDN